jgi:hypothetical protein
MFLRMRPETTFWRLCNQGVTRAPRWEQVASDARRPTALEAATITIGYAEIANLSPWVVFEKLDISYQLV